MGRQSFSQMETKLYRLPVQGLVNTVSSTASTRHTEYLRNKSSKCGSSSSNTVNGHGTVVKLNIADTSPLVAEKRVTNGTSGPWNPYRNSMFNSNVFHNNDDNKSSSPGVNPKMIGFLDMSDIQLIDKPVSKHTRTEKVINDRHSLLYSKEMEMRSSKVSQFNTNYSKAASLRHTQIGQPTAADAEGAHHPMQKAIRRTQISKHRPKLIQTSSGQSANCLNKVGGTSMNKTGRLRDHYHSLPMLSSSFMNKHLPRPVYPSVPDFSKAMTKLDMQPTNTAKLKRW